jgi:hypothetical protein
MRSDFSAAGRSALESLAVPPLRMESIRAGAREGQVRDRVRAVIACAALAVGVIGAAGLGERLYDGIHVWLLGSKAVVEVRSMTMTWNPTGADLRNAISTATFSPVFPMGLPAGTHVARLTTAPAQHPNTISIEYLNESTHFKAGFLLIDSRTIDAGRTVLPAGFQVGDVYQWRVGGETVVVTKAAISARDAARISLAMKMTAPSASFAATENLLWKTTILGKSFGAAALADEIAPPGARSVLINAEHLASVPDLVKHGKPMLDSRTVFLSDIPSVNGEPDYSRAKVAWPNSVIVSIGGVRAIDAVMRSTGGAQGHYSVLYDRPSNSAYWIWKIPMAPSASVQNFIVDARTFAVTRQ